MKYIQILNIFIWGTKGYSVHVKKMLHSMRMLFHISAYITEIWLKKILNFYYFKLHLRNLNKSFN